MKSPAVQNALSNEEILNSRHTVGTARCAGRTPQCGVPTLRLQIRRTFWPASFR
jgi:hypothetical protein